MANWFFELALIDGNMLGLKVSLKSVQLIIVENDHNFEGIEDRATLF